jgi:glucose-6-phosphate 1-dehydrogenase
VAEPVQRAEKEMARPVRRLYHLAVPPAAFTSVVGMLGETGLASGAPVIIEKPFGTDLGSVFRIDHFLART